MTKRTTRWLLCLVLVVALVASLSLVACDQAATATFVGGDGATGNAPEPITANVGEKIHLPSNTFTYANHNFAGWSDGTTVYQAGAEYTLVADVTFTAQWTQAGSDATKYTLKYELGEHAAEDATVPATQQLAEGATYTLPAGPDAEDGWIFEVWVDNNGNYAPADSQKEMPAGDLTYTAQYTEDGSGEDEPFTTEPFNGAIVDLEQGYAVIFTTVQNGDYFTLLISELGDSDSLGLAGEYRYAIEEGEITVFQNEELVGAGSIEGTLVYIALEVGDDAVEITGEMAEIIIVGGSEEEELFYLNVGAPIYWLVAARSSSDDVESVSFNEKPLDLSVEEAAVAAGEGYTEVTEEGGILALTIAKEEQGLDFADFEGIWSCGETFELLSEYDLLKVSEDGAISFHEVGYDYSGDLYSTGTSVVDGKTVVSFSQGAWTITLTLNSLEEFTMHAENSLFDSSFDKTFHKAQQVTATFELGECPDGVAPSPQQVYPGNSIYEPTKPEWNKHAFTGWFVDDQKVTFPYTINEDTTFVAHWEERSTVTVTFEANGDGVSNLPDTQTFDYGGHATRPAQQPTRDGYEFKGWGISSDSTTYFDFDGTEVKDNLTLYAIWAKRVTVTFSVDGHTDKIDAKQGVAGEPIDLPECTYEKDGWTFLGWKREGYEDLISGTTVTVQGDVTIVAVFQQTFQVDEGGRFGYTKVVVRDDGYVELFYSESYSSRYSYTYDGGTGLYTVTTYSSQIIFKTENGKAVFSDGYEGTYTSKDEKATLTLDGFGKATFKAASDPVQGTYTVKSTSAEEETATVGFTFGSDVFELTAVSQYGYFMGFSGLATVGGEKYIFGDYVYNITVTLSINDQTETVEVEYGTLFTYDGIESKAPQGKLFYAWLKDGEVFDISSTPITEEITLTAKFRVAATFDYLDGTDATVIWDEDDDGSLEVTFPDADDHTYVGGTFGGWNDKADEAEPKTLHAVGSTVTITATTHYVAVWNESTEAPFTTELIDAAMALSDGDVSGLVMLFSEEQEGMSGMVQLGGGVGMDDIVYGGFTYSIATDGTVTVADFDGSFGLKFVSGSLHGRTLRLVFSFTTSGNTTQYTFAGNLVQITLKNIDNKGTDKNVYYPAGTAVDITQYTYDEQDNYPPFYKVGGVQSDAEDFGSYIVPAEDTEIECVWEGEVTPPTGKPFTTEPFNAFLMYTRDDDTILLLQLAEEYSYVQIISEMFDGGYTEYYFEYTISADGKITVVGHDDINEDCGITFVSGTLQGRKLVFVFKNESDSQNYTFEADLVAVTFQNSDKAGNDVVVYLEEGSNLSELIVNGYCNDSDRKHPLSYNILGQSYTSETISDYTLNSDVTVVCVWTAPSTKPADADGKYSNPSGMPDLVDSYGESYNFTSAELNGDTLKLISAEWQDTYTLTWDGNVGTGTFEYMYTLTVVAEEGQLTITIDLWGSECSAVFTKDSGEVIPPATGHSVEYYRGANSEAGFSGSEPDGAGNYEAGATITLPQCTWKRQGYTFAGWTIQHDTGDDYVFWEAISDETKNLQPDATYQMPDEDIRIMATWTANTITLVLNPGEATGEVQKDITFTMEASIGSLLPAVCPFTYAGHTFKGWSYDEQGTIIINNGSITNVNYGTYQQYLVESEGGFTLPLYAIWEEGASVSLADICGVWKSGNKEIVISEAGASGSDVVGSAIEDGQCFHPLTLDVTNNYIDKVNNDNFRIVVTSADSISIDGTVFSKTAELKDVATEDLVGKWNADSGTSYFTISALGVVTYNINSQNNPATLYRIDKYAVIVYSLSSAKTTFILTLNEGKDQLTGYSATGDDNAVARTFQKDASASEDSNLLKYVGEVSYTPTSNEYTIVFKSVTLIDGDDTQATVTFILGGQEYTDTFSKTDNRNSTGTFVTQNLSTWKGSTAVAVWWKLYPFVNKSVQPYKTTTAFSVGRTADKSKLSFVVSGNTIGEMTLENPELAQPVDPVEGTKYEGNVSFKGSGFVSSSFVFTEIVVANKDDAVELTLTYTVDGGDKITETVTATTEDTYYYSGSGTCVNLYTFKITKTGGFSLELYLAELESGALELCNTSGDPYSGQFTRVEA